MPLKFSATMVGVWTFCSLSVLLVCNEVVQPGGLSAALADPPAWHIVCRTSGNPFADMLSANKVTL